ncbi:MAG: adenylate/guanylate cyclase domain-containing protein [Vicinamibacterales bacterium]|jgi:class 3 adenylate cyclase|nr:adenylate/guanylate cyclase domain-containing protein [Vicinamibacterales bacterium]
MESEQKELGVLFADISDSSYLVSAFGDTRARDLVVECMSVMRTAAETGQGTVIQRIADELLCTYPTRELAVWGAIALNQAVADARASGRLPGVLGVRMGLHYGPVLPDDESLFGESLYVASRVCAMARANQILTTGETIEAAPEDVRAVCRFVNRTTLKGQQTTRDVYDVDWNDPWATRSTPSQPLSIGGHDDIELQLQCGHRLITLGQSHPMCTIGRSERCDLTVNADDVSRVHARVEFRKGYFVVVDLSSNGTTVSPDGGVDIHLRRDELRLSGTGTLRVSLSETVGLTYSCQLPPPESAPAGG